MSLYVQIILPSNHNHAKGQRGKLQRAQGKLIVAYDFKGEINWVMENESGQKNNLRLAETESTWSLHPIYLSFEMERSG